MIREFHISVTAVVFLFCIFCNPLAAQGDAGIILRSRAMIKAGKTADAVNILTAELERTRSEKLLTQRADAYLLSGNLSAAINDFNEANKLSEHSGDYGLAQAYAMKGDVKTSLYHLSQNLGSSYKKTEKELMLNPAFSRFENKPEWRQFWKKDWYSFPESAAAEIEYHVNSGDNAGALNILKELRNSYPESDELLYSEVLIFISSKQFNDAVSAALKLSESDPGNEKYLRILAKAQYGQLNYVGASATYTRLIDAGVPDADLFLQRAGCYRKTRESEKSLRDIEKYLELYPEDKTALSLAGKVESESGDNLKAIEYFTRNLSLHPDDNECYIDRANSYLAAKSWAWAVKDYSMSLDLNPEDPEAWLNKGLAQLGSGKTADACHDFRKAYSLGNQKATQYISKHCLDR